MSITRELPLADPQASTGRDSAPPDQRGTSADVGADRESVVLRRSQGDVERAVAVQNEAYRRILANQQNAQLSTGPRTEWGKQVSSQNALKTGLTGLRVLLPNDDAARYEAHAARFRRDLSPATEREEELVQALADTQWRLNRIPGLEQGIYTINRVKYAGQFAGIDDPQMLELVLDCHIFETHAKQFNNLSIQESRLRRNYAKDLAELKALQTERREAEKKNAAIAVTAKAAAANGFVFSIPEIDAPVPSSEPADSTSATAKSPGFEATCRELKRAAN